VSIGLSSQSTTEQNNAAVAMPRPSAPVNSEAETDETPSVNSNHQETKHSHKNSLRQIGFRLTKQKERADTNCETDAAA
jgi:hypothetical protein